MTDPQGPDPTEQAIPHVLHRVWLGAPMAEAFWQYGERWEELHPGWRFVTWSEKDLAFLRNRAEFEAAEELSQKSNIARYEILLREGGVYADCDLEPLRNIEPLLIGASLVVGEEQPGRLNNAFVAAIPGHPALEYAVEQLPESFGSQLGELSPQRTGPAFWTRCVRRSAADRGFKPRVLKREVLYPYTYTQKNLQVRHFPEAYAVHHWAKSWVRKPTLASRFRSQFFLRVAKNVAIETLTPAKRVWHRIGQAWSRAEPRTRPLANPQRVTSLGSNRLLVVTEAGYPILAAADDLGVTPSLVADGVYDMGFIRFLARELREGDVAVDVGANIGLFTLAMVMAVGRTGRVFAFEPNPSCADLLEDSLYMNEMRGLSTDVSCFRAAVGSEPGRAILTFDPKHPGMGTLGDTEAAEAQKCVRTEVELVALDDVLRGVPEIRLVKVDVEGTECDVLRGMRTLLSERRVRLIDLELLDVRAGRRWAELTALLRDLMSTSGAAAWTIDHTGQRRPVSLGAALHSGGLQHLVLSFDPHAPRRCRA
jgi:FkbM family methyltransferase